MHVVTAGAHDAGDRARVRQAGLLGDRQGVHVGAHPGRHDVRGPVLLRRQLGVAVQVAVQRGQAVGEAPEAAVAATSTMTRLRWLGASATRACRSPGAR